MSSYPQVLLLESYRGNQDNLFQSENNMQNIMVRINKVFPEIEQN